jgi:predicted dehydrogenase
VLVSGRLGNGAPVDLIALLGAHGTRAPLLTVYGTEGTLELVPDERDGQIQMTSLSLFRTRGERRTRIVVMESRPSGLTAAARSVQRMYEAYARHETLPDFDDAVALHALLDDVRAAAAAP